MTVHRLSKSIEPHGTNTSPFWYLSSSNGAPNTMFSCDRSQKRSSGHDLSKCHTLIVAFSIQDSWTANATPSSRGRFAHDLGVSLVQCISPRSAINTDVLPDPVGPTMRLTTPCLNVTSWSTRNRKRWLVVVAPPLESSLLHVNSTAPKPTSPACSTGMSTTVAVGSA